MPAIVTVATPQILIVGFLIIATIVTLDHVAIVQVPMLNSFFNVQQLPIADWIIVFVLGFLVTGICEVKHLVFK